MFGRGNIRLSAELMTHLAVDRRTLFYEENYIQLDDFITRHLLLLLTI